MASASKEGLASNVARVVKHSLVAGLAVLAFGGEAASAKTAPVTRGAPISSKPSTKPGHGLTVLQREKRLIEQHKPVRFDPNFNAVWSFPGSKNSNFTSLPPVVEDHGKERRVAVIQAGGHTLKSLVLLELPAEDFPVESVYDRYYNCNATPSEWGVVKLDNNRNSPTRYQAMTTIRYSNGTSKRGVQVGETSFNVGRVGDGSIAPLLPMRLPEHCS